MDPRVKPEDDVAGGASSQILTRIEVKADRKASSLDVLKLGLEKGVIA